MKTPSRLPLLLAFAAIVFSSCTSTKMVIGSEVNQENLSSQLNNGDLITVTTFENKVVRMRVNYFEKTYVAGHEGSKNVTVPYTQIDVIKLKKVDGVKTALVSVLAVAGITVLITVLTDTSILFD